MPIFNKRNGLNISDWIFYVKSAIKVNNIPPRLQVSVSIPFIKDEAAAFVVNFCSKNPGEFEVNLKIIFEKQNSMRRV